MGVVRPASSILGHTQELVYDRNEAVRQLEKSQLEVTVLESALEWRCQQAARQQQTLEAREAELQRWR